MESRTTYDTMTQVERAYRDFVADRLVRGLRPATLEYYRQEIERGFLVYARREQIVCLVDITPMALRSFLLALGERRQPAGVHNAYRALHAWLGWCWYEYDLPGESPAVRVKMPAPRRQPKQGIGLEQVGQLLDVCAGVNASRDRLLVLLLIDTGLRRSEIARLNVGDIQGKVIALSCDQTKTGVSRPAFLSPDTIKAYKAYLKTRRKLSPDAPVFLARGGKRFTPMGLYQIVRRLCRAAGIPVQGLHAFRRRFAREGQRAGVDIVSLSRLLGHADVETTKTYLAQMTDDLEQVHRAIDLPARVLHKK